MNGIQKLPFLLCGFMAVIVGIISYISGSLTQTIYVRMAVVMIVFYLLGSFVRNTLYSIDNELRSRKEQNLPDEQTVKGAKMSEASRKGTYTVRNDEHKVDLTADDFDKEFSPLTVSRVITSKTKEQHGTYEK